MKKGRHKDNTLYNSIYMKFPERANLQKQIRDSLGLAANKHQGTFRGVMEMFKNWIVVIAVQTL